MESILVLFLLLIICFFVMRKSGWNFLRYLALIIFSLLVIETAVFGYFLMEVKNGTCFFLIGNQKILDALIKLRLSYATYFAQGRKGFIYQLDNTLGYTIGQDKDMGDMYQSNQQSFRADKNYTLFPAPNKLRVAVFGDSFVFGDGEKNKDTWPEQLERSVNGLEVLNFGVSGYGLGQSYLRYLKDGLKFHPDIIFFNYALVGDRDQINPVNFISDRNIRQADFYRVQFWLQDNILLSKSVTPFDLFDKSFVQRFIYLPLGFPEDKYAFSQRHISFFNTGLLLKKLTMRRLLKKCIAAYHQRPPSGKINLRILENILRNARQNNTMVIFFYKVNLLQHAQDTEPLPEDIRALFEKYKDQVVYLNSEETIRRLYEKKGLALDALVNETDHFNAKGNAIYAEAVLGILKSRIWGQKGARRFQYRPEIHGFMRATGK